MDNLAPDNLGWLDHLERLVSKITYYVLSGTLNSIYLLTYLLTYLPESSLKNGCKTSFSVIIKNVQIH